MMVLRTTIVGMIFLLAAALPTISHAEKETEHRPKNFSGFGSYAKRFTQFCEELSRDGRRIKFREIVEKNDVKDPECIACKPLFNSIKMMCGEKPVSRKKNQEVIVLAKAQREPHINVLRLASDIATDLASDEKRKEEIALAVKKLSKALREYTSLTPGEKDYFDILASLFESPFHDVNITDDHHNVPSISDAPQITADDLFEE